jgi:transcription elongation factor GreA
MMTNGQGRFRDGEKIFLTAEGRAEKEARLHFLRTVKRPQVADFIHEAKEAGDISDSSAYDEAKHQQAMVEGEIVELEFLLSHSEVLDVSAVHAGDGPRQVRIGSTVEVETDRGAQRTFLMVATYEADASNGKISDQSPVGRALFGKGEGESVPVTTPGGTVVYTIKAIR